MIWPPPRKMASLAKTTSVTLNLVLRIAITLVSKLSRHQRHKVGNYKVGKEANGLLERTLFAEGAFTGSPTEALSDGFLDSTQQFLVDLIRQKEDH